MEAHGSTTITPWQEEESDPDDEKLHLDQMEKRITPAKFIAGSKKVH